MDELDDHLEEYLVAKSASILKCDPGEVSWADDLDEFGFSSVTANKLCATINDDLDIDMTPAVFLEHSSLEAISEYLKDNHYAKVKARFVS